MDVIDIGAAFGDTAIYFLFKGAKKVVGYEAFPGYHSLAIKNIENNGFSDRCQIKLCAAGGKNGEISIDCDATEMFGTNVPAVNNVQKVPVTTLAEIVAADNVSDALLKLDTEGFEYEILFNSTAETLRKFKYMLIEYHYGYQNIEDFLKSAGFEFFHTGPTDVYVPHLSDEASRNMQTGHIIATRLD